MKTVSTHLNLSLDKDKEYLGNEAKDWEREGRRCTWNRVHDIYIEREREKRE